MGSKASAVATAAALALVALVAAARTAYLARPKPQRRSPPASTSRARERARGFDLLSCLCFCVLLSWLATGAVYLGFGAACGWGSPGARTAGLAFAVALGLCCALLGLTFPLPVFYWCFLFSSEGCRLH
jgi:hypothetical protein